jgi:hypothetical protein
MKSVYPASRPQSWVTQARLRTKLRIQRASTADVGKSATSKERSQEGDGVPNNGNSYSHENVVP